MSDAIETIKKGDIVGRIFQDKCLVSPRGWYNLGKMVCFHKRYDLGDNHDHKSNEFNGWDDFEQHLIKEHGAVIILPLFLYDHSGLSMKVGSFRGLLPQGHAEFDSGQVGFVYATKEAINKEYIVKRITKETLEKAEKALRAEVETYDQYLTGDVYDYVIVKKKKCGECSHEDEEVLDSCGGFYGMDTVREALEDAMKGVES